MIAFMCLNVADSLLTWRVLNMGGIEVNWYGLLLGPMSLWLLLLSKIALAVLFALLVYKFRKSLFKPLNIGMGLIVAFNLGVWVLGISISGVL